ncbi:dr1-associated corepressor isoform X3 [Xiphias gladius]|uniref:dr1-associated corepressor isoform X3 n=1 Tax=Xiphias gladius TaxID=8245 RepID=UPI001A99702F|nr:dr1-associated corepressor isoform X3 [Xiphias gladius]
MPGQKRRYNVRFPPSRIKKIMQKDTEVGRIAMAVPVIISRALEMFLKSLLTKACLITQSKLSTVVSVAHMKQCIESEKLFHFLRDLAERATSTAALKDSRGMRPDVMKYPLKKRLTWVKWRREGASTHLTTTQAPASRSSTSAYDCECTARGNCCDHSSRFILSFFFFFFKSFFILAFLFLGTMLGKKTVIFTFTR